MPATKKKASKTSTLTEAPSDEINLVRGIHGVHLGAHWVVVALTGHLLTQVNSEQAETTMDYGLITKHKFLAKVKLHAHPNATREYDNQKEFQDVMKFDTVLQGKEWTVYVGLDNCGGTIPGGLQMLYKEVPDGKAFKGDC
jgi:hypothetical protein